MRQRIATPLIQRTQEPSHAVELKFPKFRRTFRLGLQEQGEQIRDSLGFELYTSFDHGIRGWQKGD